jgi:hypothetical protein
MTKIQLLPHQVQIMEKLKKDFKKFDDGLHAYIINSDLIHENFRNDAFFIAWYRGYEEAEELSELELF